MTLKNFTFTKMQHVHFYTVSETEKNHHCQKSRHNTRCVYTRLHYHLFLRNTNCTYQLCWYYIPCMYKLVSLDFVSYSRLALKNDIDQSLGLRGCLGFTPKYVYPVFVVETLWCYRRKCPCPEAWKSWLDRVRTLPGMLTWFCQKF